MVKYVIDYYFSSKTKTENIVRKRILDGWLRHEVGESYEPYFMVRLAGFEPTTFSFGG